MKTFLLALTALSITAACSTGTVSSLTLPVPTTVYGEVSDVDDDSFVLTDATGSVEVEWEGDMIRPSLYEGEQVAVSGILDEDASIGEDRVVIEEMDAYCIRRENGRLLSAVPVCPLGDGTR